MNDEVFGSGTWVKGFRGSFVQRVSQARFGKDFEAFGRRLLAAMFGCPSHCAVPLAAQAGSRTPETGCGLWFKLSPCCP